VVEQVRDMVCKYWDFSQIWDCAAGDGHLVSWFPNVILSDINTAILNHNGFVQDYLCLTRQSLSKKPFKDFDKKNGIIIVNPSYRKEHIKHLIQFAKENKLRMCIFGPGSSFPTTEELPIVDGFFSTGWGMEAAEKSAGSSSFCSISQVRHLVLPRKPFPMEQFSSASQTKMPYSPQEGATCGTAVTLMRA
jgi:hypothetical protein